MVERKPLVLNSNNNIGELESGDSIPTPTTPFTLITSATTATSGDRLTADVSGGTFDITLPPTPSVGDTVEVNDFARISCTTNFNVLRNGTNIEGEAEHFVADVDGITAKFEYVNVARGWKIQLQL